MTIEGKKASSFPLGCGSLAESFRGRHDGLVGGMSLRPSRSVLEGCGRQSCVVKGQGNL